jgi:hypothetical protein
MKEQREEASSVQWGHLVRRILAAVSAGFFLAGPASALQVGQKAADFALTAPGGKLVKLTDLLAKGPVVIYTFIQVSSGV